MHRKIERVRARPIKDERRRRYVSVSRRMHAAGRRKSIYHDRDVTPDIRAGRSTIYRLDRSFAGHGVFFVKTRRFHVYDCKISTWYGRRCPFAVPNLRQCLSV